MLPSVKRLLVLLSFNNINTDEQGRFTPVYMASQIGLTNIVDLLIKAGANIHLASTEVSRI